MKTQHRVVPPLEWDRARRELLAKEKAFTRQREELAAARRALPWELVNKEYRFSGADGEQSLIDLFAGRTQLIVQHFMFAPEWTAGCKSCSFWADGYNDVIPHLAQRDVTMVAVSRASHATLHAFAQRMGWNFPWYSSAGSTFSYDFHVSFKGDSDDKSDRAETYNYAPRTSGPSDLPGVSVFARDDGGGVYHTYSCYARGLDTLNAAYQYLDLVPNGRNEAGLPHPMAWVRLHDEYGNT